MNPVLSELRIPGEVQEFFNDFVTIDDKGRLVCSYGDKNNEYFNAAFGHHVPVTDHIWIAGNQSCDVASHLFICRSAIEAIAFLSFHYQTYRIITQFAFISFGLVPSESQFQVIERAIKRKKFSLVMGNDLLGRICDIKIAAGLQGHTIKAKLIDQEGISITFRGKDFEFSRDRLTLSGFEKRSKFRSYARTFKPKGEETFLAKLLKETDEKI